MVLKDCKYRHVWLFPMICQYPVYIHLFRHIITILATAVLFLVREQEPTANAVMTTLFLVFASVCQLILFLLKNTQIVIMCHNSG